MQQFSDAELQAIGREIHGMFHAGATRDEALARLRTRLSRGQWDQIPRILRPWFNHLLPKILGCMWGSDHCGPDHEIVICDEPRQV